MRRVLPPIPPRGPLASANRSQPRQIGDFSMQYRLRLFAIGVIVTLAGIAQAAANCFSSLGPCGPAFAAVPEMYVVIQGPVYSGPGSFVTQRNYIEGDQVAPIGYPYV